MFIEPEVTKCSVEALLLGSPKRIKSDYSGETRQRVYQTIRKTTYTPWQSYENQGLSVRQSIFPNAMLSALWLVRGQTQLPVDKRL